MGSSASVDSAPDEGADCSNAPRMPALGASGPGSTAIATGPAAGSSRSSTRAKVSRDAAGRSPARASMRSVKTTSWTGVVATVSAFR
jgi:hypothetical protein